MHYGSSLPKVRQPARHPVQQILWPSFGGRLLEQIRLPPKFSKVIFLTAGRYCPTSHGIMRHPILHHRSVPWRKTKSNFRKGSACHDSSQPMARKNNATKPCSKCAGPEASAARNAGTSTAMPCRVASCTNVGDVVSRHR